MDNLKWFFKGEEVKLERWTWGVVYKDGTELHQFDSEGVFHQIGEVAQDNVKMFCMVKSDGSGKRIDLPLESGMRLIHKYKMVKAHYLPDFVRIYCFGYKKGDHYHFNFILPDDRLVQSTFENIDLPNYNLTN